MLVWPRVSIMRNIALLEWGLEPQQPASAKDLSELAAGLIEGHVKIMSRILV